ncbi:retbindin [Rhinophrynus dorsalis]
MTSLLFSLSISFLLFSLSRGSPGSCSPARKQKPTPSAEPSLGECLQYTKNACCSPDHLAALPITAFPWGLCGPLSSRCELYVSRIQCMYLCSPHISAWGHPESASGIQRLPLCHGFCDQWYDACQEDLICTGTSDTANCSQECIQYKQLFGSGKQLCDNIWGDALVAVTEPCNCITPLDQGADPSQNSTPEDLDTTEEGPSGSPAPCSQEPHKINLQKRVKQALRKRSIFVEDVEGSGSGF